jgi:hypothetical protein
VRRCRMCKPCVTPSEASGIRSWLKTLLRIRFSSRIMSVCPIWLLLTTTPSKLLSRPLFRKTRSWS